MCCICILETIAMSSIMSSTSESTASLVEGELSIANTIYLD